MSKKKINKYLVIILAIICLSLIFAFFVEYILGHVPCNLCLYQRIPYVIAIVLILIIIIAKKYERVILFFLSILFSISAILAFYHFGIEQNFFNESFVCENNIFSSELSKDQLLEQLKKERISCKDVNFKVMGLSLATINTIFSFFLSVIFMKLFKHYEKNK
jgi:disulfide bond formation protein DsbB